jgi:hypothetical protein
MDLKERLDRLTSVSKFTPAHPSPLEGEGKGGGDNWSPEERGAVISGVLLFILYRLNQKDKIVSC